MIKKWVLRLIVISICVLAGCQEKSSNSSGLDNKVSEVDETIEPVSNQNVPEVDETMNDAQLNHPVVVKITDPRTLEIVHTITPQELGYDANYDLYKSKIKELAKQLARGTDASKGYDQTMVLDKIEDNGQILKGNPGMILKESELVEKILVASKNGDDVQLPLYAMESNYKVEDIPSLDDVIVASFTTYFNTSEIGRSKNVELSAITLNNILVGDGDYFSFNTMVGERTEAKGYQPALEIINKQFVMGIGGGICQTSSTLFNAVDQTGIRITERHHHSLNVGYVPTGRDATVSYGTLDFKFQNTSGAPFLIKTFYRQGELTIEIRTAEQYKDTFTKF